MAILIIELPQVIDFNIDNSAISFSISNLALIVFLIIGIIFIFVYIYKFRPNYELSELELNFKISTVRYKIQRNYENIEIAHRIYSELITRKAAIPFDDENDVISEVYNSWYELFKVIREEIKKIPGKNLVERSKSEPLVQMSTDILNKGLRPHLTKFQAKYRKWYQEQLESSSSKGISPQEIQRNYPEYIELVKDLKEVNNLLLEYSGELQRFIDGQK